MANYQLDDKAKKRLSLWLKGQLLQRNMTCKEFEEMTTVSDTAISQFIRQKPPAINGQTIVRFEKFCGMERGELLNLIFPAEEKPVEANSIAMAQQVILNYNDPVIVDIMENLADLKYQIQEAIGWLTAKDPALDALNRRMDNLTRILMDMKGNMQSSPEAPHAELVTPYNTEEIYR